MKSLLILSFLIIGLLLSSGARAQTPVVILHGLFRSGNDWEVQYLKNYLMSRGVPSHRIFTPSMPNTLDCVESISAWFQNTVQNILNQTGSTKVDVIAHSLGGIVTRHYINFRSGNTRIRKFIDIASPHAGTWSPLIVPLPFCSAQQVLPWSFFLWSLNTRGYSIGPTQYATIAGDLENIVTPYWSAHMPGATNRTAWGADHFSVINHPETLNLIRSMLNL